jgi:preprotein translocase subunit YajC
MHDFILALMLFAPPAGGQTPNPIVQFVPLVLIFVVFYFFLIRPQQKKQKDREKLLENVKRGDRVVTIGGVHGTVAGIESEKKTVLVQIADNVKVKFERSAIASIEKQETGDTLATKE